MCVCVCVGLLKKSGKIGTFCIVSGRQLTADASLSLCLQIYSNFPATDQQHVLDINSARCRLTEEAEGALKCAVGFLP